MPAECWALEYARGPILTMLPFGLADTFSSLVLRSLAKTLWIADVEGIAEGEDLIGR